MQTFAKISTQIAMLCNVFYINCGKLIYIFGFYIEKIAKYHLKMKRDLRCITYCFVLITLKARKFLAKNILRKNNHCQ